VKPSGVGRPKAAGRGGGAAGIRRRYGGDGANIGGPRVSGRGERRWFGEKGATEKRKRKPMNVP
jgi:hypothetical protein